MVGIRIVMLFVSAFIVKNTFAQQTIPDSIKVYHSIGKALSEPEKVQVLEITNITDLDSLEFLSEFEHLESLSLIDFHFTTAPVSVSRLTTLKELRFINDDFYTIPDAYKELVNLERIEFIYDTHLDLENTFNFVSELPALVELRIEGLPGLDLPDDVAFPQALKILSLRNNHLNAVPPSIVNLNALEILDIGNNELLQLPEFLTKLQGLNAIYLDQQPFLKFDSTFELLKKIPTLQTVHLEGNHLSRKAIEVYTRETLFHVFLDEDHGAPTKLYTPHINMNLPPMSARPSGKMTLIRFKN